jgi:hypothetical protein
MTDGACHLLSRWFLGLFFDPENGGDMFIRNVGRLYVFHSLYNTADVVAMWR